MRVTLFALAEHARTCGVTLSSLQGGTFCTHGVTLSTFVGSQFLPCRTFQGHTFCVCRVTLFALVGCHFLQLRHPISRMAPNHQMSAKRVLLLMHLVRMFTHFEGFQGDWSSYASTKAHPLNCMRSAVILYRWWLFQGLFWVIGQELLCLD